MPVVWRLEQIVEAVHGTVLRADRKVFTGISTDSRTIAPGELFIPLKGPSFDGHRFIGDAVGRSNSGTLCERGREEACSGAGTVIVVNDGTEALMDLARFRRNGLAARCIAITGSNGKTTTRELLVRMMTPSFAVACNEKNYNNRIGISKTLLAVEAEPSHLVLEVGTNHKGEIAELARLIRPDISIITNVNASHLEGLATVEGVLEEKLSLFELTTLPGAIVVNGDDRRLAAATRAWPKGHLVVTYGIEAPADCTLLVEQDLGLSGFEIVLSLKGEQVRTATPLLGRHNLYNVLAAATLASLAGVKPEVIGRAVRGFDAFTGRLTTLASQRGFTLIDDTYNANPASMEYAVATLANLPCRGKRIAILGEMRELGEETARFHSDVGKRLRESNIAAVLLFGSQMKNAADEVANGRARFFEKKDDLIASALEAAEPGDIVLVKGSRALRMDEIVEALR